MRPTAADASSTLLAPARFAVHRLPALRAPFCEKDHDPSHEATKYPFPKWRLRAPCCSAWMAPSSVLSRRPNACGPLRRSGQVSMSPPSFRPFTACARSKSSRQLELAGIDLKPRCNHLLAEMEDVGRDRGNRGGCSVSRRCRLTDGRSSMTSPRRAGPSPSGSCPTVPGVCVFVTARDVEHGKPAPNCLLLARKLLGQKSRIALSSKMPGWRRAAEAAGAAVVVVTTTPSTHSTRTILNRRLRRTHGPRTPARG